jgi:hypothetical protein
MDDGETEGERQEGSGGKEGKQAKEVDVKWAEKKDDVVEEDTKEGEKGKGKKEEKKKENTEPVKTPSKTPKLSSQLSFPLSSPGQPSAPSDANLPLVFDFQILYVLPTEIENSAPRQSSSTSTSIATTFCTMVGSNLYTDGNANLCPLPLDDVFENATASIGSYPNAFATPFSLPSTVPLLTCFANMVGISHSGNIFFLAAQVLHERACVQLVCCGVVWWLQGVSAQQLRVDEDVKEKIGILQGR